MPVDQSDITLLKNMGFSPEEIAAYDRKNAAEEPTPSSIPSDILRYVVPTITALMTGNPLVGGVTAAGTEALARKTAPPEKRDVGGGGGWATERTSTAEEPLATTAVQSGVSGVLGAITPKYAAPVTSRIISKVTNPLRLVQKGLLYSKEMPIEQRVINEVLYDLGSAPSVGQASNKGLADWIDNIVRSGQGSRQIAQRLDEKNIGKVQDAVSDYLVQYANVAWNGPLLDANGIPREIAKRKFGTLMRGLLHKEIDFGQKAVNSLYQNYRSLVEGDNLTVPAQGILDVIRKNQNNMFMRRVIPKIKPWLKTEKVAGETAEDALSKLAGETEETLLEMDDQAIGALLDNLGQTVKEIPLENATEILRVLNTVSRGKSRGDAAMASILKNVVQPEAKTAMRKVPGAEAAYDVAQDAYGKLADRLYNKPIQSLLSKLKDYPSTVVETVMRGDAKYDTLLALKKGIAGGASGQQVYEESVLTPLRHQVITEAIDRSTGRLSGQKLAGAIDDLGEEFSSELFGKGASERLRDFATTLARLERQTKGSAMWVQLMQGGMILGSLSSLAYSRASDSDSTLARAGKIAYVPATIAFMSPLILARFAANPAFLRALTKGLESGPGTQAFARIGDLYGALVAKEKLSNRFIGQANEFYNGTPEEYIQPHQAKLSK